MASQYAPTLLRQDLDKIPLWRGDGVSVKQLTEDYAKYPYLQRLRSPAVLVASIQDGLARITWTTETFAIADSWDEKRLRFVGLRINCNLNLDTDSTALLVKPEAALRQLDAERSNTSPSAGTGVIPSIEMPGGTHAEESATQSNTQQTKPKRFFGTVKLDPARLNRDAAQVSTEVVQLLASLLSADVEVTLEIQARVDGGIPDNIARIVSENCKALKFLNQGFEQD